VYSAKVNRNSSPCCLLLGGFFWLILGPWRLWRHVAAKHRLNSNESQATTSHTHIYNNIYEDLKDRLCGLVVRRLGYRSGGPGSILGTTRKKSSGSGTGSTQPREFNWGATWKKSSGSCLENRDYGRRNPSHWPRGILYPQKLAITSPTSSGPSVV
jgi:hypothetical protein